MKVDCSKLWPENPDASAGLLHWSELIARAGFVTEALKRPFLLVIRGVKPFGLESHGLVHAPVYDDTGVLLVGDKYPVVFPMASHSYQKTSKASPDVDGDGDGDTGSLRVGRYILQDLKNGAEILFHVRNPDGTSKVPVWRDLDNDGNVTADEVRRSEEARKGAQVNQTGMWADAVLLHGGLDSEPTAAHRYSIACLTCSTKWRKMMADAAKPFGGTIDMELATALGLLPFVDKLVTPAALRDTDPSPPPSASDPPLAQS